MIKYQVLILTFILYYAEIRNCGVFCAESNGIRTLASIEFDHPNADNYHKDLRYKVRSKRELKEIDFDNNSDDSSEQDRVSRGVAKSKHLRIDDAHQIANYFLTGGPLKGHSHFRRASDCDSDNNESGIVGMSNPGNEDTSESPIDEQTPNTNDSDSIVGAPRLPLIPSLSPVFKSLQQLPKIHPPTIPHPSPMIHVPPHPLSPVPVEHTLLGSILHPRLHPHISRLHHLPSTLVRAASMPMHGLLTAQSELHNIFQPHKLGEIPNHLVNAQSMLPHVLQPDKLLGSVHTTSQSDSHSSTHHEPIGYIVQYVPHNKRTIPPIVGATHQEPSDPLDNAENAEEDTANDENED